MRFFWLALGGHVHELERNLPVAVAGLQTLLATTGYCLGCKMYFLRWWVPSLFAPLFGRNDRLLKLPVGPLRQV